MRWAGHVERIGEIIIVYKIFVSKPEGRKPLRRPCCRWEHNFKINLGEIGLEGVDSIYMAQVRSAVGLL
jgi:hypothetical protein